MNIDFYTERRRGEESQISQGFLFFCEQSKIKYIVFIIFNLANGQVQNDFVDFTAKIMEI